MSKSRWFIYFFFRATFCILFQFEIKAKHCAKEILGYVKKGKPPYNLFYVTKQNFYKKKGHYSQQKKTIREQIDTLYTLPTPPSLPSDLKYVLLRINTYSY